jgi:hypothetical protein
MLVACEGFVNQTFVDINARSTTE